MVRGRMPRESNPIPREKAGFVSNFDSTGNEDYVRISPDNPMPNANYIQNDNGLWVPVSKNNPMPTQLTGSYEEYEFPVRDIPAQSSTNYYIDVVDVFGTMNNIGVALYAANLTGAKTIVTVYSMPKNSLNSASLNQISEVIYDSNIARDNQYPGQAPITNIAPKYRIEVTAANDDLESFKLVVYGFKGA